MDEKITSSLLPGKGVICFICQGLLADPRVCDSCGEFFCLKCLENLSKCPNKECFSEKMSCSLPCVFRIVPCQNQGCVENFFLARRDEHLLNCKFLPKCDHQCEICRIENMKLNNKISELSQFIQTVKIEQKNTNEMSQAYETKMLSLESSLHEKNNLLLQTQGIIQRKEGECKILKDNLLELEQKHLAKVGECQSLKNTVLELEQKIKTKSEPTFSPPIQDNPKQFDPNFGKNYYTFSDNFTKATWKQSSAVAGYSDFQHYPVVRISSSFKAGFCVKFIMRGYGWFGLGSPDVSCEGFPGYTAQGWVIRNSDGGMYHNNMIILNSPLSCNGQLTMATYDPVNGNLNVECGNQKANYKYNFPKEVYFVFSVTNNASITLVP